MAGAACPASVRGDQYLVDQQATPNRFLVNALEILDDGVGDDDGLCESSEACIYSPHAVGAYQGEGPYDATCVFQGDPAGVTSVTMHGHSTPGAGPP